MSDIPLNPKHAPPFLKIFGFTEAIYSEDQKTYTCYFEPTEDLTHSAGTIVQGGFVSGMLDTSMAQHIIFLTKGEMTGLTLDIDVKFYKPCAPGSVEAISKIIQFGKSIAFTEAQLFQNGKLIASATATNKLAPLKI